MNDERGNEGEKGLLVREVHGIKRYPIYENNSPETWNYTYNFVWPRRGEEEGERTMSQAEHYVTFDLNTQGCSTGKYVIISQGEDGHWIYELSDTKMREGSREWWDYIARRQSRMK